MGLDARDSRLNIGCMLGDDNVPDEESARDETCVWLDFVDSAFSNCKDNITSVAVTSNEIIVSGKTNDIEVEYPNSTVFNNADPCKRGCCRGRIL